MLGGGPTGQTSANRREADQVPADPQANHREADPPHEQVLDVHEATCCDAVADVHRLVFSFGSSLITPGAALMGHGGLRIPRGLRGDPMQNMGTNHREVGLVTPVREANHRERAWQ